MKHEKEEPSLSNKLIFWKDSDIVVQKMTEILNLWTLNLMSECSHESREVGHVSQVSQMFPRVLPFLTTTSYIAC